MGGRIKSIAEIFDEFQDEYTAKMLRWVPYYREMMDKAVGNLPENFEAKNILDLGCGNGNVTALLQTRFPDAQFHLVDASPEMLTACRKRFQGASSIQFYNNYFQELEFESEQFDLIVAVLSLHHLRAFEKQSLFKKMRQWLQKDGYFSYSDLMIEKTKEPFHSEHLALWERDAFAQNTSAEEWAFLMLHYDTYDFPNDAAEQQLWLQEAAFNNTQITWQLIAWTHLLAS